MTNHAGAISSKFKIAISIASLVGLSLAGASAMATGVSAAGFTPQRSSDTDGYAMGCTLFATNLTTVPSFKRAAALAEQIWRQYQSRI
jgi:hypothetical protein